MKKLIYRLLGVCMMFANIQNVNAQTNFTQKNVLTVYYSYSGNTKEVAEAIREKAGGDIFEIKINHKYPEKYKPMTEQAKAEIEQGFRPELVSKADISKYDIIFIGSPNWWGTIAPAVSSFLENDGLKGKTIIPFITHGGGGEQRTITDFTAQCKECNVIKDGWVGSGNRTRGVDDWIESLKL